MIIFLIIILRLKKYNIYEVYNLEELYFIREDYMYDYDFLNVI